MMQEVADFSHSVVALGVRVGLGIIYIEVCRNAAALSLALDVGSRVPLATTAIGRAYLAITSDDEREQIMSQLRALDEAAWPRERRAIDAALEQHGRIGACSSFGEWQPDVSGNRDRVSSRRRPAGDVAQLRWPVIRSAARVPVE